MDSFEEYQRKFAEEGTPGQTSGHDDREKDRVKHHETVEREKNQEMLEAVKRAKKVKKPPVFVGPVTFDAQIRTDNFRPTKYGDVDLSFRITPNEISEVVELIGAFGMPLRITVELNPELQDLWEIGEEG